jgi:predicted P-loop ATPase
MNSLPEWDGRDRLGEMADRVPTKLNDWRNHFKVWMRAMVSQWTSGAGQMYGAQMVMMFVGAQGTRKSTFMRMILPPELRAFYIDRIDFSNKKEALRALGRFLLINIDEYDQVSKAQTAYLKHLIQRTDVKERKMYETTYQQLQRYAVFCATTNSLTPLKDETGSRRYMVVEVTDVIDTDTQGIRAIDYPQLYAQIKEEIRRGEETYFDGEREQMIVANAAEYYDEPNVVSIFCDHFRKPQAGDEELLMTPTEILQWMHDELHINLVTHSNSVFLGNYLRREQFDRGKGRERRKYLVGRMIQKQQLTVDAIKV